MSGSTAYKGRSAALLVSANGGSTFTTVGGVRTNNMTFNNNPVDITSVSSGGFQEMLADGGNQSVSISIDGIVIDNTPFETMLTQADDRTLIWYKVEFASGGVLTARFVVSSLQIGAPYNDAQTFSASLESSGTITFTVPA
jgi:predicted secreted protein